MSLADYQRKRDFARTPEPRGRKSRRSGRRFVIHKHAARNLHYDLRLEIDGVLKSWAVPKGPCLDPSEKRLAVETEDHPLEYLDFEGAIPAGEYGAGTIIVWDRGEWTPEQDPAESLQNGELKLRLDGQKLQGRWVLVKMKPRAGEPDRNWLFIKERSENTRPLSEGDVLKELPHSVVSGRTVEEVAGIEQQKKPVPSTLRPAEPATSQPGVDAAAISRASRSAMPGQLAPQLATPAARPPEGDQWLHEIKFDGYRLLCFIDGDKVRLRTRRQNDWTDRFPHVVEAARQLPVETALLDGEVVGLLPNGVSSFPVLQTALKEGRPQRLVYFVFDLLYLNGYDLRKSPLEQRKRALASILGGGLRGPLHYADHIEGDPGDFFDECRRLGLEGVVSKRRDRPYREGRTADWLKSKSVQRDEFVIGGFTEPEGERIGLGALLVGHFDRQGELHYTGKVGTGFDDATLEDLRRTLDAIELKRNPFVDLAREKIDRGTHWVKPQLVAQVQYAGWSKEDLLWHPVFQGLREDITAASIVREAGELRQQKGPASGSTIQASTADGVTLSQEQLDQLAGVRMTHPERVVYPELGITKLELARYYAAIAEWILPHLADRPLSLVRCPEGQGHKSFFQKHPAKLGGTPAELTRVTIDGELYLVVNDLAGLVSLVQIGVLEIHPWGARADRIERPDRLIFDLDPAPDVAWHRVIETAARLRDLLRDAGLESFVKTTGGKGLHIVLPIDRRHDWAEVKAFAGAVAGRLAAERHDQLTTNPSKQARRARIYIDYHRNSRGATAAAAYSTRNHPQATVSTPLAWEELSEHIGPQQFTVRNVIRRLAALDSDPWADLASVRQSLSAKVKHAFGV
jgi:bifunctional non-homologous end joining protein LigD